MDPKNEVAGITFLVGLAAAVLLLTGLPALIAGILPLAVGSSLPGQFGGGRIAATGSSMVSGGALRTTLGLVGLVSVWAAVESGYFEPRAERESDPATDERENEDDREDVRESDGGQGSEGERETV